jgi:hypothetical protein
MVRTFLKAYMELGSYFLFLQEQIKDIIMGADLTPPTKELLRSSQDGARKEARRGEPGALIS